jgi:hypothetical protein
MPLDPQVIDARIWCHIAAMKVAAARVGLRREGELPLPGPAPSLRRPRPGHNPLGRPGPGGDGHGDVGH